MLPKEPVTPPICLYSRAQNYAKLLFDTDLQMIMKVLYYITDLMIIVLRQSWWNEQSDGPKQMSGSAIIGHEPAVTFDCSLLRFIIANRASAIAVYEKGNQFEKLHFDCFKWLLSLTDILSAFICFCLSGEKKFEQSVSDLRIWLFAQEHSAKIQSIFTTACLFNHFIVFKVLIAS